MVLAYLLTNTMAKELEKCPPGSSGSSTCSRRLQDSKPQWPTSRDIEIICDRNA